MDGQDWQRHRHRDPPQQLDIPGASGVPIVVAVKVTVGDQEPTRLQVGVQASGQGLLPAAHAADLGGHDRVRGALADGDHPRLRERRAVGPRPRVAELRGVVRGLGGVPVEPVDGHQPPRPQPRPPSELLGHRDSDGLEHLGHRRRPQPRPRLSDPPGGRHRRVLVPAPPRTQRLREPDHDLLVVIVGVQRQRHREIHHHVRGRLAARTLGRPATHRNRGVHHITRHRPGQHPQRDQIGQRSTHLTSHNPMITRHGRNLAAHRCQNWTIRRSSFRPT